MQPEFELFGITLQAFGILLALGFVGSGITVHRHLVERSAPPDWAYEMIFAALVGGLIGARLYWLIENPSEFSDDPLGSLFGGTGLTWYGGAFGGAIAVLGWGRFRGVPGWDAADLSAVPLAVGYAIGRIGCQISGDGDYGKPWDGPWAMGYPRGTVPTDPGVTVHPTPIYETLAVGLLAWVLWRNRHRFASGVLFGLYLIGTGVERFLVEFVRRNPDDVGGTITEAQLIAIVLVLIGATVVVRRRGTAGGRGAVLASG